MGMLTRRNDNVNKMADTEVRQRLLDDNKDESVTDPKFDPKTLPLRAKLKLARKAHEDPLYIRVLEVSLVFRSLNKI